MIRCVRWGVACLALLVIAGCGSKSSSSGGKGAGGIAMSKYDSGPRAGDAPVAEALAERGAELFKTKGCTACHAFGQRLTCPDVKGVTRRRTAQWMEQQILHPEIMTKEDPIARQLFAEYALEMPNQGVTPDEAKSIIEYLKKLDEESEEAEE